MIYSFEEFFLFFIINHSRSAKHQRRVGAVQFKLSEPHEAVPTNMQSIIHDPRSWGISLRIEPNSPNRDIYQYVMSPFLLELGNHCFLIYFNSHFA